MSREASEAEIKKSYRRLARSHHPDAIPGDHDSRRTLQGAHRGLRGTLQPGGQTRLRYIRPPGPARRRSWQATPVGRPVRRLPGHLRGFLRRPRLSAAPSSAPPPRRARVAVADAEVEVEVSLREAAFGADREVNVQVVRNCGSATGSGGRSRTPVPPAAAPAPSGRCARASSGRWLRTQTCSTCGGRGRVIDVVCDNCRGSGRISEVEAQAAAGA